MKLKKYWDVGEARAKGAPLRFATERDGKSVPNTYGILTTEPVFIE